MASCKSLYNIITIVSGLTEVSFGEEAGTVHGSPTEGFLWISDELARVRY